MLSVAEDLDYLPYGGSQLNPYFRIGSSFRIESVKRGRTTSNEKWRQVIQRVYKYFLGVSFKKVMPAIDCV